MKHTYTYDIECLKVGSVCYNHSLLDMLFDQLVIASLDNQTVIMVEDEDLMSH